MVDNQPLSMKAFVGKLFQKFPEHFKGTSLAYTTAALSKELKKTKKATKKTPNAGQHDEELKLLEELVNRLNAISPFKASRISQYLRDRFSYDEYTT
jgi:hypothetical protein